jgi:hypothetical protein
MADEPKPFTDAQRDLFGYIAKLNRAKADTFREADRWIDTPPPTDQTKYERFRDAHLAQARERRTRRDRCYGIELSRPETGYGIVTYRRQGWRQMPDEQRQQVLRDARNYYGQNLRYQRREWAERIREEAEHGPLQPHELIDLAASKFTRTSEPLVFDAMNPQQKALWARRLLRVVWILTDTADLATTELAWLREWKWGEHQLEFLGNWPDGDMRPIPRLWLRVTTFDREIEEWERLTRDALRALEDAELGATTLHQAAANTAMSETEGHFSPAELAAKYNVDAEATRKAMDRWRRKHAGGDGYTENPDRRPNEPQFLYALRAVALVMEGLKNRTTGRAIRRSKTSGQCPAR